MINMQHVENALPKLQEEKNLERYVYKKDNMYIFLDDRGNKITTKDYDDMPYKSYANRFLYSFNVNNHIAKLGVAKKGNKIIIINSQGEEMFTLCNLFDDYEIIAENFMTYITRNKKFGIKFAPEDGESNYYRRNENILQRDKDFNKETNTVWEENKQASYMYFKNDEIVLQVVIKENEKEEDTKLAMHYAEFGFGEDDIKRELLRIAQFYQNKKEYYLLDIHNGTKTRLECNNLIYDAYYNENNELCEIILLYSNGTIPFYDTNESGYFEKTGEKTTISTKYLIGDVNEKYRIIFEKETGHVYFMSIKTGTIEKVVEEVVYLYKSFYFIKENDKYIIVDKDLNEIASSDDKPLMSGYNFMIVTDNDDFAIYYYDNKEIKLIDKVKDADKKEILGEYYLKELVSINAPYSVSKQFGDNIYYTVGIISYDEKLIEE